MCGYVESLTADWLVRLKDFGESRRRQAIAKLGKFILVIERVCKNLFPEKKPHWSVFIRRHSSALRNRINSNYFITRKVCRCSADSNISDPLNIIFAKKSPHS